MTILKFDGFELNIDKHCVNDALFIVVSGSHAYGWKTNKSDLDIRRVYFPDIKQALSVFYNCKTREYQDKSRRIDITEYPIQNFISLLAKGNGNAVDNLFEATFPKETALVSKIEWVNELQEIILENLHLGFIKHCLGYDVSLQKDMENVTRLLRYGKQKLMLCRYKILLQGIVLAEKQKVEYHLPTLNEKYNPCSKQECNILLRNYISGNSFIPEECENQLNYLRFCLEELVTNSKLPLSNQGTIKLQLEKWLIEKYLSETLK